MLSSISRIALVSIEPIATADDTESSSGMSDSRIVCLSVTGLMLPCQSSILLSFEAYAELWGFQREGVNR